MPICGQSSKWRLKEKKKRKKTKQNAQSKNEESVSVLAVRLTDFQNTLTLNCIILFSRVQDSRNLQTLGIKQGCDEQNHLNKN